MSGGQREAGREGTAGREATRVGSSRNGSGQRVEGPRPGGPYRPAGVGLVLVQGRLEGRDARRDRGVPLVRAHELQGHPEHPAGPGEGHHREVRRQLERLHLDRPDDLPGNGVEGRARPHAVHRGRAHGRLPLRPRRLRVRAHRDHLGAAGRRERPRAAARYRSDRRRLQGASVPPPDHRLVVGPADDDPRGPVRPLSPLLRPVQRDHRGRRRRRHRRCAEAGDGAVRQHRPGLAPGAGAAGGARAAGRAPGGAAQGRHHRLLEGGVSRPGVCRRGVLPACWSPTRC